MQVVKSSSLVSVLFREVFNHLYISFFHLLVNGVSDIIIIIIFIIIINFFRWVFSKYTDPPTALGFSCGMVERERLGRIMSFYRKLKLPPLKLTTQSSQATSKIIHRKMQEAASFQQHLQEAASARHSIVPQPLFNDD